MVWDPVDDQDSYHGANSKKGKKVEGDAGGDTGRGATDGEATDGEDTVRWVFVFRWLAKRHWFNCETNKIMALDYV